MVQGMARVVVLSGLVATAAPATTWPGAWSTVAQAQIGASYDDNVLLAPSQPVRADGGQLQWSGSLKFTGDTLQLQAAPGVVATRYTDMQALDHTDASLALSAGHVAERGSAALTFEAQRDTTLNSELGSTGLVSVNRRHELRSAEFSGTRALNERWRLGLQATLADHRYDDGLVVGLLDYRYAQVAASATFSSSERAQLTLQATGGRLAVPVLRLLDRDSAALSLGYTWLPAAAWRSSLSLGASRVDAAAGASAERGVVYSGTVQRSAERDTLSLSARREITPNGRGLLGRRDDVGCAVTHRLTERWVLDLSANLVHNAALPVAGQGAGASARYASLTATARWQTGERGSLVLMIGHANQRDDSVAGGTASRLQATLGWRWNGLERTWH